MEKRKHEKRKQQKEKKKKLLYIMSVDWNWIAQRPHFMALELAKYYEVTVVYPRYLYRPWKGQENVRAPGRCIGVPQIPFQETSKVLQRVSTRIFERYTGPLQNYDIVWFGTPMFARLLPRSYSGTVVYDYMDDIAALQTQEKVAEYVRRAHAYLLRRADLILVTSRYLMDGLDRKARRKAHLVRNAYKGGGSRFIESTMEAGTLTEDASEEGTLNEGASAERSLTEDTQSGLSSCKTGTGVIRLGYVGTISGWMDFPLLMESLERFPRLEYHLWGPAGVEIPEHERLISHGVIEHDRIPEAIRDVDGLIMPFQVNDIVLAVDPVKLYEYISFGKNIIAVRYPEVERFEPYAWLYREKREYLELMEKLCQNDLPVRYSSDEQAAFLKANSWEIRGSVAHDLLETYMAPKQEAAASPLKPIKPEKQVRRS